MEVGGQVPVRGARGENSFQLAQSGSLLRARLGSGKQIGYHPYAMPGLHRESRLGHHTMQFVDVEASVSRPVSYPSEQRKRLLRTTSNGSGQDCCRLVCREQADPPARTYTRGQCDSGPHRLVDELQDVMTQAEVGAVGRDDLAEVVAIACRRARK